MTASSTAPGRRAPGGVKIAALATGFVMASLDTTVVNVAGAAIQADLGSTLTQLTWIVDGYILTFASLLLLAGGLANRVGARVVYQVGMAVFFFASLACALAPNAETLIVARLVQGVGAALFMPSSLSLLVHSFPEKKQRTRMLGLWSAIVATSSGLGPTLGGLMVGAFGWPSIFLLNLPIGVIGMVLTRRYIAPVTGKPQGLAVPGHLLGIVVLASISFGLIEGPQLGWASAPVLGAAVVAVLAIGLLSLRERRATTHLMPWTLFHDKRFAGANLIGFLFNFALFGSIFMLGLFFQNARGADPFEAGLQLLPMTIFFPIANIVFSRISGRYGNGLLMTVFLTLAAVSTLSLVSVSEGTPYWVLALGVGAANIGAGIISPGMTAVLVDAAGPEHANVSGSVLNANRQIGSLVGVAAMGVVLHAAPDWYTGASVSFLLIGLSYGLGALVSWRMLLRPERREAAAAGQPEVPATVDAS
ncbi:MFS transporter [Amycolatopsis roodepoortensis]|uniref:DHA2 family methylenomycin A resistance protein-like MFS transporter n=1 Tax=Amycolatopsis roodepoortensis TaxID=700274 RepID=A0ABR9LHZ7_9PSEU|nr:MFS transporter [Amycolatopsis roodepoortensis]MBE1580095.1 DHA2 family methylenomycin A resistance protein-like MFS transporter [Amycolatopsis roodepoortensis]